ncbi:hypothetical protein GCM10029978_086560 [Actinoallomurus acanthiterrae]
MDEKWLRELLDEASRKGVHDDVVHMLEHAGLDRRAKIALGHIGLTHLAAIPPGHRIPTPRPPHEAMVRPAATDPEAATELYARHSGTVHRALAACPDSATLQHLAGHATAASAAAGHAAAAHPADAHHGTTDAQAAVADTPTHVATDAPTHLTAAHPTGVHGAATADAAKEDA